MKAKTNRMVALMLMSLWNMNVVPAFAKANFVGKWEEVTTAPSVRSAISQEALKLQDDLWKRHLSSRKYPYPEQYGYVRIPGESIWMFVVIPRANPEVDTTYWLYDVKTKKWGELNAKEPINLSADLAIRTKKYDIVPHSYDGPEAGVWDGKRFLFWIDVESKFGQIWTYEPNTQKWDVILCPLKKLPGILPLMAITKDRVIIMGGIKMKWKFSEWLSNFFEIHGTGYVDYVSYEGVVYDLSSKTWKNVKSPPEAPKYEYDLLYGTSNPRDFELEWLSQRQFWTGKNVVVFWKNGAGGVYDPDANQWRLIPKISVSEKFDFNQWQVSREGDRFIFWNGTRGRALTL